MSLNELAKETHQIAVEHGWWEPEPTFGELVALMHSELSESLEEYRAPPVWGVPMVVQARVQMRPMEWVQTFSSVEDLKEAIK